MRSQRRQFAPRRTPDATPTVENRLAVLQRCLAVAAMALLASTWPLWTADGSFPAIPWTSWALFVPEWVDAAALAGLLSGLMAVLVFAPWRPSLPSKRWRLAVTGTLAVSFGGLLLLDQQRLQPWAWHLGWVAFVLATARPAGSLALLRILTIGIYAWSAFSKFDATFLAAMGPDLMRGLLDAVGLGAIRVSDESLSRLAWLLPAGELAVAGLLAFPGTVRFGLGLSLAMHAALLLILGPLGLDQQPGVLIWNLYVMVQNVLLFWWPPEQRLRNSWRAGAAEAGVGLAMLLPLLEPLGLCDHWPAWAVYDPGAERVTLLVEAQAADDLPAKIRAYLGPPAWSDGRRVVRTDLWSLDRLGAPIYPQGRFRAGVALAIVQKYGLGRGASLVVESPANRWTGRRARQEIAGAEAMEGYAESFWINTEAR